eukprot:TRINITY_DN6835_c0_g1_i1.p2 TRINITY_DN6835_c0_g1~~TRINITY_DN6835_c0_g1_i1.p2  ORF type:complete len:217 (+),score=101.05 TRINITY_DN6835_c0_g1_i1:61-711(+)
MDGKAHAGVVLRPIAEPSEWAAGCPSELLAMSRLPRRSGDARSDGLLTSNGSISAFLGALMDERGAERVKAGGCGNKVLMLLEQRGGAYVQDRGVSRWDTCAAQALLEAHGGVLGKLDALLDDAAAKTAAALKPYTYTAGAQNADFVAGRARLTPYNASPAAPADAVKSGELAQDVAHVQPYSNLNGLVALRSADDLDAWRNAAIAASKKEAPQYN